MISTALQLWLDSESDQTDSWLLDGLRAGCEQFNMKTGIISKVIDDRYIIQSVYTTMGDIFSAGMEFELQNTYCEAVIRNRDLVSYLHVGKIPAMILHPVYQAVQLESYVGIPLYVDDQIDGTLNFSSYKARKEPFSEQENTLLRTIGTKIEAAI